MSLRSSSSSSTYIPTSEEAGELAALDRQNQQLAYLQDEAQNVTTERTYHQANIQSTRGWHGLVSRLYTLFTVFFVALLAFTLPADATSSTVVAVRVVVALCVMVFPWCVPVLAAGAMHLGAKMKEWSSTAASGSAPRRSLLVPTTENS